MKILNTTLLRPVAVVVFAVAVSLGAGHFLSRSQSAAKPQTPSATTRPPAASNQIALLQAELDQLKAKLPDQSHAIADVGDHFANLWLTGEKKNWPLAKFYFDETRSHLRWAVRIIPVRKSPASFDVDLKGILDGVDNGILSELGKTIAAEDNLFAGMTYEGGASINGPFLGTLGASAAAISIIAGVGEFLGYSLHSVAGYVADKTGKYWLVTFIGYSVNLLAVPAMALAESWQAAGILILTERMGRAIRKPTVEAMLSYSTGKHGKGWVYAVNTAMDETGAMLGPLLIGLVLYLKGDFRSLLYKYSIPAVIVFSVAVQLLSLPLFVLAERASRRTT